MAIDQPMTVYPQHDSTGDKAEHTEAELDAVTEEWRKRHGGDGIIGRKVSLEELLGGGKQGQGNI